MTDLRLNFRYLLDHLGREGKYQYFWTRPAKRTAWFEVGNPPSLPEAPGTDIYFSVHPTALIPTTNMQGKPVSPEQARGRVDVIAAINCLFAEFDEDKGASYKTIDQLYPPPSVVISSGGGWHAYWLLAEPERLDTEASRSYAKRVQAAWVAFTQGDPGAKDLARVLRVVGSFNFKYQPPRPVEFSALRLGRLYTLDDLKAAMGYVDDPEPEETLPAIVYEDRGDRVVDQHGVERVHPEEHFLNKFLNKQTVGSRNETGYHLALQLRDSGISQARAEVVMLEYARQVDQKGDVEPYTEREALASLRSAYQSPPREPAILPRINKDRPEDKLDARANDHPDRQSGANHQSERLAMNDVGNGKRLAELYGDQLRYVASWGWMVWNRNHWEKDKVGGVMRMAKRTAQSIYQEAGQMPDERDARDLAKWAHASHSKARLDAMIALAASEPPIPALIEQFDADPLKINVQNGLLDLETGELFPHRSEMLVTKVAGAAYQPDASYPRFTAFLDRIMDGNEEMIAFLQRAVGYTLTGHAKEQVLFFLHGRGANGKSTFLETLRFVLGGYAKTAAPNLIVAGDRHPTELADLSGARMVITSEVEDGQRMAEEMIKRLTGGEVIKGRYMHQDFFDIAPTFKLWLAANHMPVIRETDHAIWRRIKRVPFVVTISDSERDPHLMEKLQTEASGILAWAVEGYRRYQERGLDFPTAVQEATNSYRVDMDVIGRFIAECCVVNSLASVPFKELYEVYKAWAENNGVYLLSSIAFSRKMKERGFTTDPDRPGGRGEGGRHRVFGIGLLHTEAG